MAWKTNCRPPDRFTPSKCIFVNMYITGCAGLEFVLVPILYILFLLLHFHVRIIAYHMYFFNNISEGGGKSNKSCWELHTYI